MAEGHRPGQKTAQVRLQILMAGVVVASSSNRHWHQRAENRGVSVCIVPEMVMVGARSESSLNVTDIARQMEPFVAAVSNRANGQNNRQEVDLDSYNSCLVVVFRQSLQDSVLFH